MSFGGRSNQPADTPTIGGLDETSSTTNQQAIPIPYAAGEFMVPLILLTPAYNQRAAQAPDDKPAKK